MLCLDHQGNQLVESTRWRELIRKSEDKLAEYANNGEQAMTLIILHIIIKKIIKSGKLFINTSI